MGKAKVDEQATAHAAVLDVAALGMLLKSPYARPRMWPEKSDRLLARLLVEPGQTLAAGFSGTIMITTWIARKRNLVEHPDPSGDGDEWDPREDHW